MSHSPKKDEKKDEKKDAKKDDHHAKGEKKEEFAFQSLYCVMIKHIRCKNLIAKDLNGSSDPYVIFNVDGVIRKTINKSKTLHPDFGTESFVFSLAKLPKTIGIEVKDHDMIKKDETLGKTEFPLSNLSAEKKEGDKTPSRYEGWIPLNNVKTGEIHICVELSKVKEVTGHKNKILDLVISDVKSLLEIHIHGARKLKSADIVGKSDPYVKVNYDKTSFLTPSLHNTNDPEWNEICPIWITNDTHVVSLTVWDEDKGRKNEVLGSAYFTPNLFAYGMSYELWLPLKQHAKTDAELTSALKEMKFDNKKIEMGDPNTAGIHITVKHQKKADAMDKIYQNIIERFDLNKDNRIEVDELIYLCQVLSSNLTDDEITKLFTEKAGKKEYLTQEELFKLFQDSKFQNADMMRRLMTYVSKGADGLTHLIMRGAWTEEEEDMVDGKTHYHNSVDNSGTRILVQDRASGLIVQENIPSYLKAAMRLFYRTIGGRMLLNKALGTIKVMTERQGKAMDDPKSKANIPAFIKTHNLNVDEMLLPLDQFKTFNEFFYRKLKPGARVVDEPDNPKVAISPADSRMMVFRTLDDGQKLWIKGEHFTLSNLFGGWDKNGDMAKLFAGGSLVIARLAPQDYHRWHFPVSGTPLKRFPIDGEYMTVNPIAVRKNVDVYTLNKRCICPIETKEFGLVVLIAIAATAVGSINFDKCDCKEKKNNQACIEGECQVGKPVKKFDPHGYFAFGGSTTLVLFQPGVIAFDTDLLRNSDQGLETLIKVGSRIGVLADPKEQKDSKKEEHSDKSPKEAGVKK